MTHTLAPLLCTVDGRATTTSRDVAAYFGKRHDHVLTLIRQRMAEAGEWGVPNFRDTPYIDPQNGQSYPMFTLSKDGFTFLAQKFSGKKAVQFQLAYINAFNAMEAALHSQPATALPPAPKPSYMQEAWFTILHQQATLMLRCALARALQVSPVTVSQVLNGTGKYGSGQCSTARMAQRVLYVFTKRPGCARPAQPRTARLAPARHAFGVQASLI